MKNTITWLASSLAVLAITTAPLMAQSAEAKKAELITKLKKVYPLETCLVCGDKLVTAGAMSQPVDYLYEEQGKNPRLVRFSCQDCINTFQKTPAKYLKMLDEAAAKTNSGDGAAPAAPNHEGHHLH